MSLLEVEGTVAAYGSIRATHGVSFSVEENEIIALVGSNGAGKSSTLKAIMGLVRLAEGSIRIDGDSVSGERPYRVVRRGVAFSPEGRRVFAATSVLENLMAGAHILPRGRAHERLDQIFSYFPRLRERSHQLAGNLSGGEQQMLAIGRALMSRPRLLLLDEPSLGLAPVIVQRIGELICEIQASENLAVVLAEQNSNWALRLATRGLVLEVGRIRMQDSAGELLRSDYVRRAYLGM
ncbi:MAG: ABC transporter ATP-binding protein [Rhizobiaceae bacterium]|nr:MAG: ABC transporter ATP-binding protein [Rhizobiaceae bacterium]